METCSRSKRERGEWQGMESGIALHRHSGHLVAGVGKIPRFFSGGFKKRSVSGAEAPPYLKQDLFKPRLSRTGIDLLRASDESETSAELCVLLLQAMPEIKFCVLKYTSVKIYWGFCSLRYDLPGEEIFRLPRAQRELARSISIHTEYP